MGAHKRRLSLGNSRALALALVVCAAPAHAFAPQGGEDDQELFAFQIYDTQAARALQESAIEHLGADRWSEALVDLQALIEEHAGDVLGGSKPTPRGSDRPSEHWVHEGAAAWATRKLFELKPEARQLYVERHADRAARAFATAIEDSDRAGLTVLARRWPVTRHALRAWWALGDLELELGNESDAFRAWGRGLGARAERSGRELRTSGAVASGARPSRGASRSRHESVDEGVPEHPCAHRPLDPPPRRERRFGRSRVRAARRHRDHAARSLRTPPRGQGRTAGLRPTSCRRTRSRRTPRSTACTPPASATPCSSTPRVS